MFMLIYRLPGRAAPQDVPPRKPKLPPDQHKILLWVFVLPV